MRTLIIEIGGPALPHTSDFGGPMRASVSSWLGTASLLAALLGGSASASAQAPPPLGHWRSGTSTAQLYVYPNGNCAFLGTRPVQGTCTWSGTSRGGILTLFYPMPLEPGKIYFNIVWVNQTTISVFGELLYRQ